MQIGKISTYAALYVKIIAYVTFGPDPEVFKTKGVIPKMKNPFSPKVRGGGYGCIVIIACALIFSSCENFLKGGEVAKQIEETIAYNNAKIVKVNLYSNDEMGIITPDSTYDARLGFNFKLQFIPNTQNYVISDPANVFEAVSIKDNSVSRADCVEFTPIEQTAADKKEGIYYAYAKVTKAAEDIRIRPKCALVPKVTSVWPPNDNTSYPQDSSIKVSFNKAIKLSDFADENGFLKNITITSGDSNLLDKTTAKGPFYKSPCLADEGKTLVIPIVKGNYVIKDSTVLSQDLSVTLKLENLTDGVEGENAEFLQREYSFSFKINPQKDSDSPELKILRIARTEQDARNGTNLISMDEFTHYADSTKIDDDSTVAQNIQNHHVNKIWIYFEAEDEDSGVGGLEVQEQLIRNTTGNVMQGDVYNRKNQTAKNNNFFENQTGENNYKACVEYDFNSSEDGVVKLEFVLYDRADNHTNSTRVNLVKDTICQLEVYLYDPSLKYVEELEDTHNAPYKIELKQKNDKFLYATDIDNNSYYDTFLTLDSNDYSATVEFLSFEYGYDKNNMNYIDLKNSEYDSIYETSINDPEHANQTLPLYRKQYYVNFNVDPYKDVYTKITIRDLAGNIKEFSNIIPKIVQIYSHSVSVENDRVYWMFIFSDKLEKEWVGVNGYYYDSQNQKKPIESIEPNHVSFYLGTPDSILNTSYYYISVFGTAGANSLKALPKGIYKLSPLSLTLSENRQPDFYSYGGNFVTMQQDEEGWSVVYANDNIGSVSSSDIPSPGDWTVQKDIPELNTGKRTVTAQILDTFVPNPDLSYFIRYEGNSSKGNIPITDFKEPVVFTIPTEYSDYNFYVDVYNQKNESASSEVKTLDLSYDNISPFFDSFDYKNILTSSCTIQTIISDSNQGVGFKQNGEIPLIKYYLSNKLDLNNIDWKKIEPVNVMKVFEIFGANNPQRQCTFDLLTYEQDLPRYIYLYTEDKNGNTGVTYIEHHFEFCKIYPVVTVTDADNSEFKIDCSAMRPQTRYGYELKANYYLNNNKWVSLGGSTELGYTQTTVTINKTSFIKVQPTVNRGSYGSGSPYGGCTYPKYFYQPYEIAKAKGGNDAWECKLKDLYLGQAGINILADRPCFAHTMYCPRNLGNKEEAWLIGGLETGLMMEDSSFTYSYDNTSGVPAGYYYTTVVHFADGTTLMTPVKQK